MCRCSLWYRLPCPGRGPVAVVCPAGAASGLGCLVLQGAHSLWCALQVEVILLHVQLQPEGIMLLSQLGHMGSIPYYVASRTVIMVSGSSVCFISALWGLCSDYWVGLNAQLCTVMPFDTITSVLMAVLLARDVPDEPGNIPLQVPGDSWDHAPLSQQATFDTLTSDVRASRCNGLDPHLPLTVCGPTGHVLCVLLARQQDLASNRSHIAQSTLSILLQGQGCKAAAVYNLF